MPLILQFGDARVGDLGVAEQKRLQPGQPFEVHQSGVGDLGVIEADFHYLTVVISLDLGFQLLQCSNGEIREAVPSYASVRIWLTGRDGSGPKGVGPND